MTRARRTPLLRLVPFLAVAALALAACGSSSGGGGASTAGSDTTAASSSGESSAASESPAGDTSLTVGGANFTEMNIMQQLYGQLLEKAGYSIDYKTADNREIYEKSLESGEIDVVPEYAATMAEFLNLADNGPDATPIATNDAASTVAAMQPLLEKRGLTALQPAEAADQNGFAVTKQFAEDNNLTTLSDLAALGQPITLAATEECPDRPFCQPGLEDTYGLNITKVLPLGFGSAQAKQAVIDGKAQLVLTGTTDGTLDGLGLVLLQDDKHLQLADNLVPVVNQASAGTPQVADVLNGLSAVLTTEDLTAMIVRVDADRELPDAVAKDYLTQQGLL